MWYSGRQVGLVGGSLVSDGRGGRSVMIWWIEGGEQGRGAGIDIHRRQVGLVGGSLVSDGREADRR